MFYLKFDTKPKCCGECDIDMDIMALSENFSAYRHYCPILDKEVKEWTIDPDCPVKELKPKQLKWEEKNNGNIESWYYKLVPYIYDIETDNLLYHIFFCNRIELCTINGPEEVNECKKFCQDHYNKLFKEMIGGE